jgi:hypothetical protein
LDFPAHDRDWGYVRVLLADLANLIKGAWLMPEINRRMPDSASAMQKKKPNVNKIGASRG